MTKLVTVVGARPQFVKAATVSRVLARRQFRGTELAEVMVHTGQHFDDNMSEVFFREMDIPRPDYKLDIQHPTHGGMTGRMLEKLDEVITKEAPDLVLVYGDTNSTLAGALAAVKLHIPLAHVEAGLRSFNRRMPEEVNRVVSDHIADLLFAPTALAVENLLREGIPAGRIVNVGDVMYDAALFYARRGEQGPSVLERVGVASERYILSTIHRAENTNDQERLANILGGLAAAAEEIAVVLPLHPRTRAIVGDSRELSALVEPVSIIDPVGYLDMVSLEQHSAMVVTDSGGVQKEAFFFGKPCVTLRDETEWMELVDLGWNVLAPPRTSEAVYRAIKERLGTRGREDEPYGQGDAAEKIVQVLLERYG